MLAVIGDRFGFASGAVAGCGNDELCGVVLALKFNEDVLSIWNKSATNKQAIARIRWVAFSIRSHFWLTLYVCARRDVLKKVLNLSSAQSAALSYTAHDEALKGLK